MTNLNHPLAILRLNEALDRKRTEHGFPTDAALADHLEISDKTLSFFRNGRLTKTQAALVAVLTDDQSIIKKGQRP